jgi:hypothetical protein
VAWELCGVLMSSCQKLFLTAHAAAPCSFMCQVAEVVWNFAGGGDDLFGFSIFQHRIAVYHPIHQYLPTYQHANYKSW